jgi:hypothetical protein
MATAAIQLHCERERERDREGSRRSFRKRRDASGKTSQQEEKKNKT